MTRKGNRIGNRHFSSETGKQIHQKEREKKDKKPCDYIVVIKLTNLTKKTNRWPQKIEHLLHSNQVQKSRKRKQPNNRNN